MTYLHTYPASILEEDSAKPTIIPANILFPGKEVALNKHNQNPEKHVEPIIISSPSTLKLLRTSP